MGRLVVVADNHAADGFVAEHGFALWLEVEGRVVLFDTGNREALVPNAAQLGLDLGSVTDLIISHGHYDHTGGIEAVVRAAPNLHVYLHQAALQPRYVGEKDEARPVRMAAASMRKLWHLPDESIHWLTQQLKLTDTIGVTGPIPRVTDYEDTGGAFFYDPLSQRPDPIEDDNALWLDTRDGLFICVGCSHAGIVNTVKRVVAVTGIERVNTVIGGFHLINASPHRLECTAAALDELGVEQLIPCHCTGDAAVAFLRERFTGRVTPGYAGFTATLPAPAGRDPAGKG